MNRFFEVLVNEHQNAVFGMLYSVLRDRQQAEDLTQESFILLFHKIDTIDVTSPILPWLLNTARKLAANVQRRRKVERKLFVRGEAAQKFWEALGSSEGGVDWSERLAALRKCREGLPESQKTAIDMFYSQGHKSNAIAELLGTAVAAIHNRLTRGRSSLRRCIEQKLRGAL